MDSVKDSPLISEGATGEGEADGEMEAGLTVDAVGRILLLCRSPCSVWL